MRAALLAIRMVGILWAQCVSPPAHAQEPAFQYWDSPPNSDVKHRERDDSAAEISIIQAASAISLGETPFDLDQLPEESREPAVLRAPDAEDNSLPAPEAPIDLRTPLLKVDELPRGFAGRSGVWPQHRHSVSVFEPIDDRFRIGLPYYDRYGQGHPELTDQIGTQGNWLDPFGQNVLKGDYPILDRDVFLRLGLRSSSLFEGRQLPTTVTTFNSRTRPTRDRTQATQLGDPDSYQYQHNLTASIDLFRGNTTFKPPDWRVHLDTVFNMNQFTGDVPGLSTSDPNSGQGRFRQDFALQEWFYEQCLVDTSVNYDFISARIGSQSFVSDFRGFIFADTNRALRLFGTGNANQDQFNLIWFDQMEKDTNSLLNRLEKDRHQNTLIANYYRQDFALPGHNLTLSIHVNRDAASHEVDRNGFQVRPDPIANAQPHRVDAVYFGVANHGHIDRLNISGAAYYVLGEDSRNSLAASRQDISAWMSALELSFDKDWWRMRSSYLYSSGDANPHNSHATGFDAIMPNTNFAGADFSYWGRQGIRLYNVELTNRQSLLPALKNSKFQSQSNFVNPGLHLLNFGFDADLTPKWRITQNTNLLWFNQTEVLKDYLALSRMRNFIGTDLSIGSEYRPHLNNNIIVTSGLATLLSGHGFDDLFQNLNQSTRNHLAGFVETTFQY